MSIRLLNVVAPVMAAAVILLPAGALAQSSPTPITQTQTCTAISSGSNTANQTGSRFTVNTDEVAGKFTVSGPAGCTMKVTISTWQAPDGTDGTPYAQQKLFNHFT